MTEDEVWQEMSELPSPMIFNKSPEKTFENSSSNIQAAASKQASDTPDFTRQISGDFDQAEKGLGGLRAKVPCEAEMVSSEVNEKAQGEEPRMRSVSLLNQAQSNGSETNKSDKDDRRPSKRISQT